MARARTPAQSASGAAGRAPAADQPGAHPQRRAGRPHRSGQDDTGRGAARRDRDDQPGRPRRGRHHGHRLRRGRGAASSARSRCRWRRSSTTASRSTCWTPPDTPTSSASCAPVCARRTRPSSSSRRRTASTAATRCCGRSARPSACRGPSCHQARQGAGRLRRDRRRSASASSATACCRCTCRWPPTTGPSAGLIGLLSQQRLRLLAAARAPSSDARRRAPAAHRGAPATSLIEGIIAESEDETLMDRYLDGEEIDIEVLIEDLEKAVARGTFYPGAAACASRRGLGSTELLELHHAAASRPRSSTRCPPSPRPTASPRGPLTCDPDGPLVAEVVKTTIRPVRRADLPGPGLLRHPAPGHHRARVRARPGRPRARGPRRRRADRRALLPARQDAAPDAPHCDRRRHRARSRS